MLVRVSMKSLAWTARNRSSHESEMAWLEKGRTKGWLGEVLCHTGGNDWTRLGPAGKESLKPGARHDVTFLKEKWVGGMTGMNAARTSVSNLRSGLEDKELAQPAVRRT